MGYPPPPDLPPVDQQPAFSAGASFEPSPTGLEVCGFGIPIFTYNVNLRLPFEIPPFPPTFNFLVALACDLSNPLEAEFGFGGGRVQNITPDEDEEFP